MAAPVEPLPDGEDNPDPEWDAAPPPEPAEDLWDEDWTNPEPTLSDDEFLLLFWDELVPQRPAPQDESNSDDGDTTSWATPGVFPEASQEAPSASSVAVLDETAAAMTALRLAQARCYRALHTLRSSDAVAETGYRSMSRLLEDHVRLDASEAQRLSRQAAALTATVSPTGTQLPPDLPATATQVEAGVIGPGHVEVIRKTMTRLHAVDGLDADTLATTERELAALATTRSPSALAQAATAICALLDPDGTAPDDEPPPENELHCQRRRNGALVGRFTYRDPAAAEALHTALSVATPPPESASLAEPDGRGPVGPHGERGESPAAHATRSLPERRAQGLLDLAGEAYARGLNTEDTETVTADGDSELDPDLEDAAAPTPPPWTRTDTEGGERVALTVTLDYETLRRQLAGATPPDGTLKLALLGENTFVRPETARRLACDAELIPALMGSRGLPLDIGRKTRVVPANIRRGVTLRDRHCAHPGCRRRARRSQIHHVVHWIDGGDTSLENCVLLCAYHHTLVHHSGWEIVIIDGMPWFKPPRWLDPSQRLRHNRPWQRDTAAA